MGIVLKLITTSGTPHISSSVANILNSNSIDSNFLIRGDHMGINWVTFPIHLRGSVLKETFPEVCVEIAKLLEGVDVPDKFTRLAQDHDRVLSVLILDNLVFGITKLNFSSFVYCGIPCIGYQPSDTSEGPLRKV